MTASTSGGTGTGPGVSRNGLSVTRELLTQESLRELGLRTPAGRLHDLAHEEAHQILLARPELLGLLRMAGHDPGNHCRQRARIGDLTETPRRHDRAGVS